MQPFGLSSHGIFGSDSPMIVFFFIFSPFLFSFFTAETAEFAEKTI